MLFSGSLQGWFAQVGAAELQATANFPAAVFLNLHSSSDHSLKLCMACRYSIGCPCPLSCVYWGMFLRRKIRVQTCTEIRWGQEAPFTRRQLYHLAHKVLIYIEHHSVYPLVGIGTPPPL
jgi:hypothetical protein